MVRSQHYRSCEEARLHQCRCTWCGGALHGWVGWIDLTRETPEALAREKALRDRAETEWKRHKERRRRATRRQLREQVVDRVRLDLVRWLRRLSSNTDRVPAPRVGEVLEAPADERVDRFDRVDPGGSLATVLELPHQLSSDSAADSAGYASSPEPEDASPSSPVALGEHAEALAEALARETWRGLQDDPSLAKPAVRHALANHFWCSLFLAFAQVVSDFQETLDKLPATAKSRIKGLLRPGGRSSAVDALLTDFIVDKIVDKAWNTLQAAVTAGSPLLTVATSKQTVQAFQLLAVFSCPNPDRHPAVRSQAIDPLARDAADAVSDEAKKRLLEAFPQDHSGGADPGTADAIAGR